MATWLLLRLLLLLVNAHLLLSSTAVAKAVSAAAFVLVPRVGVESDWYSAVLSLQPSTVCYLRTVANMLSYIRVNLFPAHPDSAASSSSPFATLITATLPFLPRDALYSAKRGLAIACRSSVCLSVCNVSGL